MARLLTSLGFRPIDAGMAPFAGGTAFLNVTLNARNSWTWQSGRRLAGPTA